MLAHEKAIERCREEHLDQATYFITREMLFYKNVNTQEILPILKSLN